MKTKGHQVKMMKTLFHARKENRLMNLMKMARTMMASKNHHEQKKKTNS